MSSFFASGHAVDLVLVFLVLEVLVLARRTDAVTALLAALPGAFLLLALRASLTGAHWGWIGLWITLSLPAHLADLARRRH
jgi:hypothetical protein